MGRCFASEDKNLAVWFELDGHVMGSRLPDMGTKDLTLKVTVKDADEPDTWHIRPSKNWNGAKETAIDSRTTTRTCDAIKGH